MKPAQTITQRWPPLPIIIYSGRCPSAESERRSDERRRERDGRLAVRVEAADFDFEPLEPLDALQVGLHAHQLVELVQVEAAELVQFGETEAEAAVHQVVLAVKVAKVGQRQWVVQRRVAQRRRRQSRQAALRV